MMFFVLGTREVKERLAVIGAYAVACTVALISPPRPHDSAYQERYFMAMWGMVEQSLSGKVLKESLAMLDSIDVSSGHENNMYGVEDGKYVIREYVNFWGPGRCICAQKVFCVHNNEAF